MTKSASAHETIVKTGYARDSCRICAGTHLETFLDLGITPLADQFRRAEDLQEPVTFYPLQVSICRECGLVQLRYVVSPEVLFRNDYPYESSTTRQGREHWAEFARFAVSSLGLSSADLVVDIGSNVGVLLQSFKSHGTRVLGVDPAVNIARIAAQRGIETIAEFFNQDVAESILAEKGQASVITGTNVFAHVDDLHGFVRAVDTLLKQNGVLIIEAPYFANLVNQLEYDTIYHEHLSYLSVKPLSRLFDSLGFDIFDVQMRDIHGGSFRVFVGRREEHPVSPVVQELVQQEQAMGLHSPDKLHEFSRAVERNRQDLIWLLRELKYQRKSIVGVSAPAKGMTLLNYCRVGSETLDFVTEKSNLKIGRFTPGGHLPVVPDDELLRQKPDYALLLAWNFATEIMENLSAYRASGGKFIIPMPTPRIID